MVPVPACPHCQKSGNVPPKVKWSPGAELVKNELKKLIFDQSEVSVIMNQGQGYFKTLKRRKVWMELTHEDLFLTGIFEKVYLSIDHSSWF